MAVAATIVMLCFSHVWPDMQRCHERESEMDFKAETSKVLRGARTRPVLLVEENLEDLEKDLEEDLGKDPESRSHSIPRNVWVRFVFGCLFTWQCLQRIGFKDLKTSFQEQQQTVRNRKSAKEMVLHSNHHVPTLSCKTHPPTKWP